MKRIKIKKNVDLSILEKYGFKHKPYANMKCVLYNKIIPCFKNETNHNLIEILVYDDRELITTIKNSVLDSVELPISAIVELTNAGLIETFEGED